MARRTMSLPRVVAQLLGQKTPASELSFNLAERVLDHAAAGTTPRVMHQDLVQCGMSTFEAAAALACFYVEPGRGKTLGDAILYAAQLVVLPAGYVDRLVAALDPEDRPTQPAMNIEE